MALLIIATVTVNEQRGKVNNIEVSDRHCPTTGAALNDLTAIPHDEGTFAGRTRTSSQNLVACETSGETIGPRLNPVTQVVDVTSDAPPARDEKLASSLSLNVLEVGDLGILGVGAERVLLAIGGTEDVEAKDDEGNDASQAGRTKR